MKSIIEWFKDEKEEGYIEYKGKRVFIYYSVYNEKENKNEYVKFEIIKNGHKMKKHSTNKNMQ